MVKLFKQRGLAYDNRHSSIVINEHYAADGAIVYPRGVRLGCEGIVSKRAGSFGFLIFTQCRRAKAG